MTETSPTRNPDASLTRDLLDIARYYLGGRRGLIVPAVAAIVIGLAFNWSWLVAAGIAPVLLSLLPCVAMCALGLCMHRMGGRSCSTSTSAPTSESSGASNTPAPMREVAPVTSTASDADDPQVAFVAPALAPANRNPNRKGD